MPGTSSPWPGIAAPLLGIRQRTISKRPSGLMLRDTNLHGVSEDGHSTAAINVAPTSPATTAMVVLRFKRTNGMKRALSTIRFCGSDSARNCSSTASIESARRNCVGPTRVRRAGSEPHRPHERVPHTSIRGTARAGSRSRCDHSFSRRTVPSPVSVYSTPRSSSRTKRVIEFVVGAPAGIQSRSPGCSGAENRRTTASPSGMLEAA